MTDFSIAREYFSQRRRIQSTEIMAKEKNKMSLKLVILESKASETFDVSMLNCTIVSSFCRYNLQISFEQIQIRKKLLKVRQILESYSCHLTCLVCENFLLKKV